MQKFEDVLKSPVFSEQYEKYSYYKKTRGRKINKK